MTELRSEMLTAIRAVDLAIRDSQRRRARVVTLDALDTTDWLELRRELERRAENWCIEDDANIVRHYWHDEQRWHVRLSTPYWSR